MLRNVIRQSTDIKRCAMKLGIATSTNRQIGSGFAASPELIKRKANGRVPLIGRRASTTIRTASRLMISIVSARPPLLYYSSFSFSLSLSLSFPFPFFVLLLHHH